MKHKNYLFAVLLLFITLPSFAQLDCGDIDMICKKAQELMSQGEYETALKGLQKAKEQPGIRNCSGMSNIDNLIRQIQNQKSNNVSFSYVPQTQRFNVNDVSFTMIAVEGGTFTMGATPEQQYEEWDGDDELPAHQVTLSAFAIGQTEVTQALWKAVMGGNPSEFEGNGNPVENMSWEDCQTFISKLNAATEGQRPVGREFRLPTEAEWEYAARGGNKSNHTQYAGSRDLSSVAWFLGNSSGETHPVAQKKPNELGLYDMSGNVWEWCQDWYHEKYYSRSPSTNPCNNTKATFRVLRGGGWFNDARGCRVADRDYYGPDDRFHYLGLRLAL